MNFDVGLFAGLEILRRFAEIFYLHLLEFTGAKGEVSRRDLVAESLSDLRDSERKFAAHRLLHVQKIDEDSLRGFGPKIGKPRLVLHGPDIGLKHQIEIARRSKLAPAFRTVLSADVI